MLLTFDVDVLRIIHILLHLFQCGVVPQPLKTILEEIMADADLDVLGRDDIMYRNNSLRRELTYFGQEFTDN